MSRRRIRIRISASARGGRGWRWLKYAALALSVPLILLSAVAGYYYATFSRQIEARLHGERERVLPRVFARPVELRRSQALGDRDLVDRLNDLGYAERARADRPGEFALEPGAVSVMPRQGDRAGQPVRVVFEKPRAPGTSSRRIQQLEVGGKPVEQITLDAPLLTALMTAGREKRRRVPLDAIPGRVQQAVIAIEDRRFYDHPGVDPIRMVGALVTNLSGERRYLEGASTLTQQLVKNFFLTPEKSLRRKLLEQFMAIILEQKATKDEILELYLNEVYLGQRGSFAVHGVAEAARLFFAKDVSNLSLAEAATIAGIIQSPNHWSPFLAPERCRERRNVVLRAMVDADVISPDAAERASREPLTVVQRALEAQAPYFVDFVSHVLAEQYPNLRGTVLPLDVYTTLDLDLQRLAQDSVREGLARVDDLLARRKRRRHAQAALVAVDPRTGEVLAMVGGRSYNQSQFNRAVHARRQPGSVFKPFVYLAAFERAAAEGRGDLTPATVVADEPTTFQYEQKAWNPGNYEDQYDGVTTFRRALAMSRNIATIHAAELAGFDRVAALWRRVGVGAQPRAYPAITLGVFEATPFEIATAYTIFPNGGEMRPLRVLRRVTSGADDQPVPAPAARRIAREDTVFLVTNMLRSVLSEGTGASARAAGFSRDAGGKSGTTNDLRDAWFVGFTPDLLTVVWVGLDDNQPLGLSGTRAALPIWTQFMLRATAGRADRAFPEPQAGITWAEIDAGTGYLAAPGCPRVLREAFLDGTEPFEYCTLHRY